jgi:hypothetical protein
MEHGYAFRDRDFKRRCLFEVCDPFQLRRIWILRLCNLHPKRHPGTARLLRFFGSAADYR